MRIAKFGPDAKKKDWRPLLWKGVVVMLNHEDGAKLAAMDAETLANTINALDGDATLADRKTSMRSMRRVATDTEGFYHVVPIYGVALDRARMLAADPATIDPKPSNKRDWDLKFMELCRRLDRRIHAIYLGRKNSVNTQPKVTRQEACQIAAAFPDRPAAMDWARIVNTVFEWPGWVTTPNTENYFWSRRDASDRTPTTGKDNV